MQRLTGLDAAFLALETPSAHMHVHGRRRSSTRRRSRAAFDRSTTSAQPCSRRGSHLVPPFRRRLVEVPFGLQRPAVDRGSRLRPRLPRAPRRAPGAGRPRRARRVRGRRSPAARSTAAARCGSCGSSRVSSTATQAFIAKMHHSPIDGVPGVDDHRRRSSTSRPTAPLEPPSNRADEWQPERVPSDAEMLAARGRRRSPGSRC